MKKRTAFILAAVCFLKGIIIGFLLAPAKNGIGNNSGNTTNHYYGGDDECLCADCEYEDCECEDCENEDAAE